MSKIDRKQVYDKYDGHCAYCGDKISIKDMQVDHIIPKRINGTDDLENLNPSCRLCNHYKRAETIDVFRDWKLDGLIERLRKIYIFNVAEKYGMVEVKNWDRKFYFEKVKKED
jgi:hypothetical protein